MNHSIDQLIIENRPMLLSYARALVSGDTHLAEDLVQETCVTAFEKFSGFDSSRSFPHWLRGILRFKLKENHRAAKRYPWVVDPHVMEGFDEVYALFDHRTREETWLHRIATLKSCVSKLNEAMRRTIELVYHHGFSLRNVADQMHISEQTAAKRASRARKLIKHCIQKQLTQQASQ